MAMERMNSRSSDRSRARKAPAPAVKTWDRLRWASREITAEAIAKRAYEKFMARGGRHGDDLRDWLEAEKELKAEIGQN